jgi:hypothetical protein
MVAGGDAEAVRKRVAAHLDAGADHVLIQALSGATRSVPLDQWRELAPALSFEETASRADSSLRTKSTDS